MAKEKVKKPFYKKWWFWLLVIIIIATIATSGEEEGTSLDTKENTETTSNDSVKKESNKATKEEKADEKEFAIGEEVKVGNLSYIVNGVEETNKISNVLGDKTTDGKFVIVELTVKNHDKESRMVDSNMFKIKTTDGTEYSADSTLDMYVNENGIGFFLEDINPNISKTGKIVFELPTEATEYNLQVSSGFGWSGGEYEEIKLK